MKQFILLFVLLFSGFCFAQNSGSILGIVLDGESYNEPLMYANVSIEGTNLTAFSDTDGLFHFENLAKGNYTLVFSFNGYETKTTSVQVVSGKPANTSASLIARTLSLNDLLASNKTEEQKDKTSITPNH